MHQLKRVFTIFALVFVVIASVPIHTLASSTFKTDLVNGLVTKSDRLTFDLWAKDAYGNKIEATDIEVLNNSQTVAVNWDDKEKTSYTLNLELGVNNITISHQSNKLKYQIIREHANDGDVIGHFVFSLDAFTIGQGYIIEPIEVPITKGRNAAQELDTILRNYGITYKSTGVLENGFYLATIYSDTLYNKPVIIPDALKLALNSVYDETLYTKQTGLGEFDINFMSGWMYSINNTFPNVGFSDKYILDGDVMRVQFTLAYGQDIGGGEAMNDEGGRDFYPRVNKDELTRKIAAINTPGKNLYLINNTRISAYKNALQVLKKVNASQSEIDTALSKLQAADHATQSDGSVYKEDEEIVQPSPTPTEPSTKSDERQLVNRIISQIQVLPNVGSLTLADAPTVSLARQNYDALSQTAKAFVTNLNKLEQSEAQIKQLQSGTNSNFTPSTNLAEVQKVINLILSLPTSIKLTDETSIIKARKAYNDLSSENKLLIINYSTLLLAEMTLSSLKAENSALQTKEQLSKDESEKEDTKKDESIVIEKNIVKITSPNNGTTISNKQLRQILNNNAINEIEVTNKSGSSIIIAKNDLPSNIKNETLTIEEQLIKIGANIELLVNVKADTRSIQIPVQIKLSQKAFKNGYLLQKNKNELKATPHFENGQFVQATILSNQAYVYTTNEVSFNDIQNDIFADDIYYLANRYVVQGSNGNYHSKATITRADFAVMISRAINATPKSSTKFNDVKGKYYEQAVQALYELKIINGVSDTHFNPTDELLREHAALMMARVLRHVEVEQPSTYTLNYADINKINKNYHADIAWLQQLGIMSGNNNHFDPQGKLTRGQMAKILKRTLNAAKIM